LFERTDRAGRRSWYGKFWSGDRQVKRRLGPVREPGGSEGLTRRQAERALRELMLRDRPAPPGTERLTFATAAERYVRHVADVRQRRRTTVRDYELIVRKHFAPFFAEKGMDAVDVHLVDAYMQSKQRDGLAANTVCNHMTLMYGIFRHAMRKGWASSNPVAAVDRPSQPATDPDIRFFTKEELEALIRAVPDDELGRLEAVLYLTAAMTGLRQGELAALRWCDVDWAAGLIRVRRSYTRGELTTPKSRRSSRAVPMADRLARELERHFQVSRFRADDDLVFAHPVAGSFYDASKMRKRFKAALGRACLKPMRFHDLRHTFGTQMAAAGTPLKAIQEWMGHRDYKTTSIYADYAPDPSNGRRWAQAAFGESGDLPAEPAIPAGQVARFSTVRWNADSGS